MSKVQEPSLADRVVLGRECGIAAWLTEAFEAFVGKWEPIDASMQEILGFSTYARLVCMRERLWQTSMEQISDYDPTRTIHKNYRPSTQAGPYGRDRARNLRANSTRVSQDIAALVTEQVQEFYLERKPSPAPGIVGAYILVIARTFV